MPTNIWYSIGSDKLSPDYNERDKSVGRGVCTISHLTCEYKQEDLSDNIVKKKFLRSTKTPRR